MFRKLKPDDHNWWKNPAVKIPGSPEPVYPLFGFELDSGVCSVAKRFFGRSPTPAKMIGSRSVLADLLSIRIRYLDLPLDFVGTIFKTFHNRLVHGFPPVIGERPNTLRFPEQRGKIPSLPSRSIRGVSDSSCPTHFFRKVLIYANTS